MKSTRLFTSILFLLAVFSLTSLAKDEAAVTKTTRSFMLGETQVNVNVYEKPGNKITFFAPHHNEQTALKLAKEYIEKNGGRLVEITSFDVYGKPNRYLRFFLNNKGYDIDPNRIYTENGRACSNIAPEIQPTVQEFADNMLKTLFPPEGKTLREGENVIVAVHNNTDVDNKEAAAKLSDLTAIAFIRGDNTNRFAHGIYSDQADGVFVSNVEYDTDNFIFLSTFKYLSYFSEKGFNVVVQKVPPKLQTKTCTIDDGSLSVYSGQQNIPYICLEADGVNGEFRQRQMIEAVYQLLKSTPETAAVKEPVVKP